MSDGRSGGSTPIRELILVPAAITLAVTLLRLAGELQGWSARFFSREAGGGLAVVGIVWLVPFFGIYFALRLARLGLGPASKGKAIGLAVAALLVFPATFAVLTFAKPPFVVTIAAFGVASLLGLWIAYLAWPALGATLIAYGLSSRIPVAAIMLIAMLQNWGTHYELGPPNMPAMGLLQKWVVIGLVPQMTLWMGFTGIVGALCGSIAVAVAHRGRATTA